MTEQFSSETKTPKQTNKQMIFDAVHLSQIIPLWTITGYCHALQIYIDMVEITIGAFYFNAIINM